MPIDLDKRRPNCLRVTRENCKVGKARNLLVRSRCYKNIFKDHGTYLPLATVEDITQVEKEILWRLDAFRIKHNRRRLEWLQEIDPGEVKVVVLDVLRDLDVAHSVL